MKKLKFFGLLALIAAMLAVAVGCSNGSGSSGGGTGIPNIPSDPIDDNEKVIFSTTVTLKNDSYNVDSSNVSIYYGNDRPRLSSNKSYVGIQLFNLKAGQKIKFTADILFGTPKPTIAKVMTRNTTEPILENNVYTKKGDSILLKGTCYVVSDGSVLIKFKRQAVTESGAGSIELRGFTFKVIEEDDIVNPETLNKEVCLEVGSSTKLCVKLLRTGNYYDDYNYGNYVEQYAHTRWRWENEESATRIATVNLDSYDSENEVFYLSITGRSPGLAKLILQDDYSAEEIECDIKVYKKGGSPDNLGINTSDTEMLIFLNEEKEAVLNFAITDSEKEQISLETYSISNIATISDVRFDSENIYAKIQGGSRGTIKLKVYIKSVAGGTTQNLTYYTIDITVWNGVLYSDVAEKIIGVDYKEKENIVIPEGKGITAIGGYCFSRCRNLKSIEIPDGITMIGFRAFEMCYDLETVVISDSVTEIASEAFYSCNNLKTLKIPDSVTTFGSKCFQSCSNITDLYLDSMDMWTTNHSQWESENGKFFGKGTVHIGDTKYRPLLSGNVDIIIGSDYSSRSSIEIPDFVTEIGTEIGKYVFNNCSNLTSITIPNSLKKIGPYIFLNCPKIKTIFVESREVWDGITLEGNWPLLNPSGSNIRVVFGTPAEIKVSVTHEDDISPIEYKIEGTTLVLTAEENHETFDWIVDMEKRSETSNVLNIDTTTLSKGLHSVMVIVDGKYSSTITVEIL